MTARTATAISEPGVPKMADAEVPEWVRGYLGWRSGWRTIADGLELRQVEGDEHCLLSLRATAAVLLDQQDFTARTGQLYDALGSRLRLSSHCHAIRLWNFIPDILHPLGDLPHRYMAFNAGRFQAYLRWFGDVTALTRRVPTASAVGHRGDSLVVHCLAADRCGTPVENPLQVASYHYSKCYGSPPPTFARATRVEGDDSLLLVGGTASVRGEHSTHLGRLESQLDDTFENLAMLVQEGLGGGDGGGLAAAWRRFRTLRVYWVEAADLPVIQQRVEQTFVSATEIEYVAAELCRPELLVEIEGVAGLSG